MNINLKSILNKIKSLFSSGFAYIRMVRALPHSGKYSALAILLIVIFTIMTFPYDYLIRKKLNEIQDRKIKSITLQKLDFNIIGESYAENVEVVLGSGEEISCKNLILNPSVNPYSIFINRRFFSDFQLDNLNFNGKKANVVLNLNGNIDVITDATRNIPLSGEIRLILSDAKIGVSEISVPGPMGPLPLKLDIINIQNGVAEIDIVNGVAKIKNFRLTGTDLNCSITGSLELSENTNNSKLDLNINIDPESAALEPYRDIIIAATDNKPLILTVKGTVGRPDVKLERPGKTE
ncbi:MAG TPA: AsmA-like C-terminal region-containing protein [Spirochaetota bacterium]|nr:AsmA-like C-terminal region-containing protein [Spirochaetota bacterium]HPJ35411.1 AsmA-like C-terminal region-containing protein [Spirochaetota bacterium]